MDAGDHRAHRQPEVDQHRFGQLQGRLDRLGHRVGHSGAIEHGSVRGVAGTRDDGRANVAIGVTDDLAGRVSAVDLVKAAVAALGGQGGGGRPAMAQGGGPEGSKAAEALQAVRDGLAKGTD